MISWAIKIATTVTKPAFAGYFLVREGGLRCGRCEFHSLFEFGNRIFLGVAVLLDGREREKLRMLVKKRNNY